jgi:hypothetical protein
VTYYCHLIKINYLNNFENKQLCANKHPNNSLKTDVYEKHNADRKSNFQKLQANNWKRCLERKFTHCRFAADKIRSSLGPRGSYKLVAYNRGPEQVIKVTKDAVAILDELAIQYPPAVIISESAKMQRHFDFLEFFPDFFHLPHNSY